jgi:hypothetical protein
MPKYNNIENIPAKLFFEVLKTKDYELLKPYPREKELEKVFLDIYNDYFIRSDNSQANNFMQLNLDILIKEYKIAVLKKSLKFYYENKTTKEMRFTFIEAVKKGFNIIINKEVPFIDEVKRVLEIEIRAIENEINIDKIALEDLSKTGEKKFDYYDAITGIANVLTGNNLVNENMTLAVYVALEKSARKQMSKK